MNPSVADFFRVTVKSILQDRKLHVQETTEFYVVNLLTNAVHVSTDKPDNQPLAILFGKAFSTNNENEKYAFLKQLGDQALFVSGFFGDSLNRKMIDVDYYISMGATAYGQLSDISKQYERKDFFVEVFDEMSEKFTSFVDLFSEISERANVTNNQDILRLYERWLFTKSERLRDKLQKIGIQPIEQNKDYN